MNPNRRQVTLKIRADRSRTLGALRLQRDIWAHWLTLFTQRRDVRAAVANMQHVVGLRVIRDAFELWRRSRTLTRAVAEVRRRVRRRRLSQGLVALRHNVAMQHAVRRTRAVSDRQRAAAAWHRWLVALDGERAVEADRNDRLRSVVAVMTRRIIRRMVQAWRKYVEHCNYVRDLYIRVRNQKLVRTLRAFRAQAVKLRDLRMAAAAVARLERRRLGHYVFATWGEHVHIRRLLEGFLAKRARKQALVAGRACFAVWRARFLAIVKAKEFNQRREHAVFRRAHAVWRAFALQRRRTHHLFDRVQGMVRILRTREVFAAMQAVYARRTSLRRFIERRARAFALNAFLTWRGWAHDRVTKKRDVVTVPSLVY